MKQNKCHIILEPHINKTRNYIFFLKKKKPLIKTNKADILRERERERDDYIVTLPNLVEPVGVGFRKGNGVGF